MKTLNVEIDGLVPILFNKFTKLTIGGISDRASSKKMTAEEEMSYSLVHKVHRDKSGDPVIPAVMIKSSMLRGSTMAGLKIGKKSAQQYIRACVFIDPQEIKLGREPDGIDERMGTNNNAGKGVAVILRRPIYNQWSVSFCIKIVDDRVPVSTAKTALEEAGLLVGIGAFRPDFGRFVVKKFE